MLLFLNNIYCWPPWSAAPSRFLNETYIFSKSDRFVYARRSPADPGELLFFPPGRPEPCIPLRTSLEKSKKRRAKTLVAKKLVDSTMILVYFRSGAPRAAPPVTSCARLVRPWLPSVPRGWSWGSSWIVLGSSGTLFCLLGASHGGLWRGRGILQACSGVLWRRLGHLWGSSWAPQGHPWAPQGNPRAPLWRSRALSESVKGFSASPAFSLKVCISCTRPGVHTSPGGRSIFLW